MVEFPTRDHICALLLHKSILALGKNPCHSFGVVQLQGHTECPRILLIFQVEVHANRQVHDLVSLCSCKVCQALKIEADTSERWLFANLLDRWDLVHFAQQVNGINFGVVLHVERHDLLHKVEQILHRAALLGAFLEFLADLTSDVADVLVTPARETVLRAFQSVLQGLPRPFLLHGGRQDRQNICEEALQVARGHLAIVLGER
mmetsp:Transcript_23303/g.42135  ORF Transcript_23303/g.42135 Transcript_23303/m.42135 type:complete len:204 (+) Transcript_23303:1846-2457(+)